MREFAAGAGLTTGPHELRVFDNGYCLFGIEFRTMDLTAMDGQAQASVRGLVVEYHGSNASLLWNTFDYLEVTEGAADVDMSAAQVNPWHGNAIDIDRDGHLLVSFRNSDQIVKIDAQTGAIIWRLGGEKNQFTFSNDSFNGFSHQHGIGVWRTATLFFLTTAICTRRPPAAPWNMRSMKTPKPRDWFGSIATSRRFMDSL